MTKQLNALVDARSPAITVRQGIDLAKACLANSERLIASSRVLLHADDTAGSLAMLAVANQEMGRAVLTASALSAEQTPASWRRFWFNFRSPKGGLRALLNWERMALGDQDLPMAPALRRLGEMEPVHQKLSVMANYTRFASGRARLPEQLLTKDVISAIQFVTGMRFVIMRVALGDVLALSNPQHDDLLEACRKAHAAFQPGDAARANQVVDHLASHVEFLSNLSAD